MSNAIVPIPKVPVSVRVATLGDIPFMDALQKRHSKALGYFTTKQFEGYVEMGAVLIAEQGSAVRVQGSGVEESGIRDQGSGGEESGISDQGSGVEESGISDQGSEDAKRASASSLTPDSCPLTPLGYCIHRDRYLKRDELGVIFQLCVAPGEQRKLVGATLVREAFARSAYGCRLYCLWCAQDLEANYFWESLGFVPIAFRAGGKRKVRAPRQGSGQACPERASASRRVHIFWQKRIREGDVESKWWYPCQTSGGAIGDDRLVFPIPPGTRWSDEMPVLSEPKRVEGPVILPRPAKPQADFGELSRVAIEGPLAVSQTKRGKPAPAAPVKHGPRQFGPPGATLSSRRRLSRMRRRQSAPALSAVEGSGRQR